MSLGKIYCPVHETWEVVELDDLRGCDYCCGDKPCVHHPESWEIDDENIDVDPIVNFEYVVLSDQESEV